MVYGSLVYPVRETLTFGTQGTVEEVLVEEGQVVEEGQALARLDATTVASLERAVARARVDLRSAEEALAEAKDPHTSLDSLVLQGVSALQDNDVGTLGELMNICQGLLNALGVSTLELERVITIAREAGAAGAKLTGGGGGGSMVAVCDGDSGQVQAALEEHGFQTIAITVGGET